MQNSALLSLLFTFCLLITIEARKVCNNKCGRDKSVPYPFGFSPNCLIQLNCTQSTGEIKVGNFRIENVTPNGIVLKIPAKCDRSIESIKPLFGPNFALSYQNSLLLQNCTKLQDACLISTATLLSQIKGESCNTRSDNISCLPLNDVGAGDVLTYQNVNSTGCGNVFSSFLIGLDKPVSLDFERVQLDWWLPGSCDGAKSCAKNAKCQNVTTFDGEKGLRCQCIDGFVGDGFREGRGCRRDNRGTSNGGTGSEQWLYGSIGVGFAAGLLIPYLMCAIRRPWSDAYFMVVDKFAATLWINFQNRKFFTKLRGT